MDFEFSEDQLSLRDAVARAARAGSSQIGDSENTVAAGGRRSPTSGSVRSPSTQQASPAGGRRLMATGSKPSSASRAIRWPPIRLVAPSTRMGVLRVLSESMANI